MSGMHSGPQVRFLCDQNLGRLAKWLRILGFDTEFMPHWDEDFMKQAIQSGRIVLTRKATLSEKRGMVFISYDHVQDQLQELTAVLDLTGKHEPFIRCSRCNTLLVGRNRDEVKGQVPDYVYAIHEIFVGCPLCGRIFWKGTHISHMYDMIHLVEEGLNHDQARVR
jgi:uncharacterized protein with PIN domain